MNEGLPLRTVVACVPGPAYAGAPDLEAHNLASPPHLERSRRQHRKLISRLEACGARVVVVDEPPGQPNATFARDAALVTAEGYVELRMGLPARRSEPAWMVRHLDGLGVPRVGAIEAPGTVEGGDVVLLGDVALVGRSRRTNAEGIRQLSVLLRRQGCRVRVADVPGPHLHLGGLLSAVGPERVVAVEGTFDGSFLEGFAVVGLPERPGGPPGANVVCVGPDEVVANVGDGQAVLELLEAAGVAVHGLDLSEFRKGNGGPTCLVLPVERG